MSLYKPGTCLTDDARPAAGSHGVDLYTRYPIVARRAWPTPLSRVRRASKGILHTRGRHSRPRHVRASDLNCYLLIA